jgi:hypothetical protein
MADATTREIKLLEINLRLSGGAYLLLSLGKLNLIEQCLIDNSDITPSKDTRNIEVAKVAYVDDYIEI